MVKEYINKTLFYFFCFYYSCYNKNKYIKTQKTYILAHRGLTSKHLENTLEAFLAAFESGADGIEFDVQLSKDLVPVVFHDYNLQRLSGSNKNINNINILDLNNIILTSSKYDNKYSIPLLSEVLLVLPENKIINIELKETFLNKNKEIYHDLISLLSIYRNKFKIIISSFHADVLIDFLEISKDFELALLIDKKIDILELIRIRKIIKDLNYLNPHLSLLDDFIARLSINFIIWGHKKIENKINLSKQFGLISDICEKII